MGPDILYCGKWRKNSKSCLDLDLGLTMPNIGLFRVIFIYYNVFKFHVPRSILTHTETHTRAHTHTYTHTDAHKDPNEYSIVEKRNYNNLQGSSNTARLFSLRLS